MLNFTHYLEVIHSTQLLQAALADTSIPTVEVQTAEDPNDEPELEVLDDNAVKLDISNVPIILTVSQVLLS